MEHTKRLEHETGQDRKHNALCEYAHEKVCMCWCKGKYHGIAVMSVNV